MQTALTNQNIQDYINSFVYYDDDSLFVLENNKTKVDNISNNNIDYLRFTNEFWTSKQRQASSLHEIAYRACYKPQLPNFFIKLLTKEHDIVYDPFAGRGTTAIEAALLNRRIVSNDINPLSRILTHARLEIPDLYILTKRLEEIPLYRNEVSDIDLSMFYHHDTLDEILSLRRYLNDKRVLSQEDSYDRWIRMVATNRLTGHSKGFFSVYTLPPNQSVSQERQKRINKKLNQNPQYRNTKELILKKTKDLIKNIDFITRQTLSAINESALFLDEDAGYTPQIESESVDLTVTSPPFLNVINYIDDNWLRCWFNLIDMAQISERITMSKTLLQWSGSMSGVFKELYRITKRGGYVAFEVGEVLNGKIKLDEYIIPLGINAGFSCIGVLVNKQTFTKTSNIWGIDNNAKGTNTNRIVLLKKEF